MPRAAPRTNRFKDKHGRTWTMTKAALGDEADRADIEFWLELTPAERVDLVAECWLDWQRTKGRHGLPRFRRVCRVIERP